MFILTYTEKSTEGNVKEIFEFEHVIDSFTKMSEIFNGYISQLKKDFDTDFYAWCDIEYNTKKRKAKIVIYNYDFSKTIVDLKIKEL